MKTTTSVIVPTLNNIKGVNYLKNYFKEKPYKIIIIDNSKKNLGFAGGVNKGVKAAKTKWLLILNDDIEFKDDKILLYLIKVAEKKKLDAVSPILRNPNGEIENYGYKVLPYGRIQLIKNPKSEIRNTKQTQNSKLKILNSDTDGLTAACLLIKSSVFKKLKGFDEKFFAYLEDVDFFLRFKKAGYKMGIVKDVEVIHNHMTTSKTMGNFKQKQDMINWWRLYFKHQDRFKFDLAFIIERLRNLSGFVKASF